MSDRKLYSREELLEMMRSQMEAAGFTEAMGQIGQIPYLVESMRRLVGDGDDPKIPVQLRRPGVIFEIRDKADAAANKATEAADKAATTDKSLTAFMGTTNSALAALQLGQRKGHNLFSKGIRILWKQIDDKDDAERIDWKKVVLLTSGAGGVGAMIHGAFTWIPKAVKALSVWIQSIHI